MLLDSFEVTGPHGKHIALALQVSQMSLRDMDLVFMKERGFDEGFVKAGIKELLFALDFLHTEVKAVHTGMHTFIKEPEALACCKILVGANQRVPDVHPGNLLLGLEDESFFEKLEKAEMSNPVARKQLPDRTIYLSRIMKPKVGPLLLSDFGETKLGPGPHAGDIMPIMYRAPETLLHIQWSYPVDIWSVGLTVSRVGLVNFSLDCILTRPRPGTFSKARDCSLPANKTADFQTAPTSPNSSQHLDRLPLSSLPDTAPGRSNTGMQMVRSLPSFDFSMRF